MNWPLHKQSLIVTGFPKSLSNMHIIIHRLEDVFQQLSNGVFGEEIKNYDAGNEILD